MSRHLHPLYFIADIESADRVGVDLAEVARQFVRAGGRMASLRVGKADDETAMEIGRDLSGIVYAAGGTFLVHRRIDLVELLGADGVHLPTRGFARRHVVSLLGNSAFFGRSAHGAGEVRKANREGASFATLGPMFKSISKPGYGPAMNADEFSQIADDARPPVYALGGVTPGRVATSLEAGAFGVAVVGGILHSDDPFAATGEYLDAIEDFLTADRPPAGDGAATGEC